MKSLITITLVLFGSLSWGYSKNVKTLSCSDPSIWGGVDIKLEPTGIDSQTGVQNYNPQDGGVTFHYASSNLQCYGSTLDDIGCLGYWFGSPAAQIAEVKTSKNKDGVIQASVYVNPYRRSLILNCTLK